MSYHLAVAKLQDEADLSQNAGNNVYERMARATRDLILSQKQKVPLCDTTTRLDSDTTPAV
jgi:hypothetical protein